MPAFSQEDEEEEGEATKYTVREYLEQNLPTQEGRKIAFDELKGLLTLTDTPSNHQLALRLIREWDVGPKQVSIEAKFLEITITGVNEWGVEWTLARPRGSTGKGDLFIGGSENTADVPSGVPTPGYTGTNLFDVTSLDYSGLGLWVFKETLSGTELRMWLQALQREAKVNLLNAPRVTTLSGQQANIQIARIWPYAEGVERKRILVGKVKVEVDGDDDEWVEIYDWVEIYTIAEKTIGINLDVTPTVMEGSNIITLDIFPEVTKVHEQIDITEHAPEGLGWPVVDTRATQTSIMVRSGETVIMGGLIESDEDTTERKIPFLGDIPLIGNLFRYNTVTHERKNLVILLTATIINPEGEPVR